MSSQQDEIRILDLEGNVFRLETSLWLPQSKEEVFPFFADAKNLEKITPPWLNFRILSQSTPEIQKATTFDYALKLKGIPIKWRSLISEWKENELFVDEQLKGPYKKWHHLHRFSDHNNGTLMEDIVHFCLPFGWLGKSFGGPLVKRDVAQVFSYRASVIRSLFLEPKEECI